MITILDSVYSQIDKPYIKECKKTLQYTYQFPKPSKIRDKKGKVVKMVKKMTTTTGSFVGRNGVVLTGLVPRLCKRLEIDIDTSPPVSDLPEPHIEGITLRDDQKRLIENMVRNGRGVVKSPTRSGKTIIAMGFMSLFSDYKFLFLVHSLDIAQQAYDEFIEKGFDGVAFKKIGDRITVCTIQTWKKLNAGGKYFDYHDGVIVDECHHAVSRKSQYGKALCLTESMFKFGFTATLPEGRRKRFALEGLIGPVIGEVTQEESIKLGITMAPDITLVPVPRNPNLVKRTYKDIYDSCIVNNRMRNRLIAFEASERVSHGSSVLIMVKEILHGYNVKEVLEQIYKIKPLYVKGDIDKDARSEIKSALIKKKSLCVISTAVWREGVNIPSLNCVINGIGGKSETMILQSVGRSLTKEEGKDSAEIVDFLDEYRYLAEHTVKRLKMYIDQGWM